MIQIIKYKWLYIIFSAVLLVPGIISLFVFKLDLSIDFTGGSVFKYKFNQVVDQNELKNTFTAQNVFVESISKESDIYVVRTREVNPNRNTDIKAGVAQKYADAQEVSFETVGPAIGGETTKKAFVALIWAMVGILLYIAYAFRNIPKPYSSFRFGISAILAMFHDALMVLGLFSILGHFGHVEVDSLFITAVLTVIGFSVHDTIVVFDRIRENLGKLSKAMNFSDIVNYSVVETLSRSLATSLTVLITLFALFILGGETIKTFVLAMLVGVASGTYSSIFTASPILVIWEEWESKRHKKL